MPDITKETITTNTNTPDEQKPVRRDATSYQTAGYFIYFIFGILEVLLAFRFILKLFGANPTTGFVDFIYGLSGVFVSPFTGIFSASITDGNMAAAVFEPATLVSLAVYAVIAWGIVALIKVVSGRQQEE